MGLEADNMDKEVGLQREMNGDKSSQNRLGQRCGVIKRHEWD